jgi:mannose-6-phosphate isomerase class I
MALSAADAGRELPASVFFQASRLTINSKLSMSTDRGFYCLVALQGEGKLVGKNFDYIPIRRGKSAFIPTTLDDYEIVNSGQSPMEVICCYPPTVEN